ncbi:AAA family ATPase [Ruminococcus difficilis]|uniref:AAA family ATPase n=1 Tax=Ruminococcus difficilis TaxID=2763069 RepID=A0A934WTH6_9FIRM|nr:AAA family ATPase [Ruminococcus difficilis]MBK6089662.1 AAA family ATPase [Ruminococcus difficilis]
MSIVFEPASRAKSKARIAVTGPSGSGKTLSSLLLAYGLTGDWNKVAIIDTEHGRARFYAERKEYGIGKFLYQRLDPPYSPERYIDYVTSAAQSVGEDGCVIIDSFSHAWDNEGGVLDIKDKIASRNDKNSYTAWSEAGKIQNSLVNTILSVECHTITTMRAKMAYAMEEDDRGRMKPVKIGLAPVQRDNTEYEFDIVFQIDRQHNATLSKDTTFLDRWSGVIDAELGKQLGDWLNSGVELPRCADCGKVIMSDGKRSVDQIVTGTIKNYGRQLCMPCASAENRRRKEAVNNAASSVSE